MDARNKEMVTLQQETMNNFKAELARVMMSDTEFNQQKYQSEVQFESNYPKYVQNIKEKLFQEQEETERKLQETREYNIYVQKVTAEVIKVMQELQRIRTELRQEEGKRSQAENLLLNFLYKLPDIIERDKRKFLQDQENLEENEAPEAKEDIQAEKDENQVPEPQKNSSPLKPLENLERPSMIDDLKTKLELLEKARAMETDKTAFQPLYPKIAELDKVLEDRSKMPPVHSNASTFSPEILEIKSYYEKQRAKKIEMLQNMIKPKEPSDSSLKLSNKMANLSDTQKREDQKVPTIQIKLPDNKEDSKLSKTKEPQRKLSDKSGDKSPDKSPAKKKFSVIKEEEEDISKFPLPSPSGQQLKTDESITISKRDDQISKDTDELPISKQDFAKDKKATIDEPAKQQKGEPGARDPSEKKEATGKKGEMQDKANPAASKDQLESQLQQPVAEKKDSQKPKLRRPNSQMAASNASERISKVSDINDPKANTVSQAFNKLETVTSIVFDKNNPSVVEPQKSISQPAKLQSSSPFQTGFSSPFGMGGFNASTTSVFQNPSLQSPVAELNKKSLSNIDKPASEEQKSHPVPNYLQKATSLIQKPIFAVKEIDDDFPDF